MKFKVKSRNVNIKNKREYELLLKSGMFWELYPELSGDWKTDKNTITKL